MSKYYKFFQGRIQPANHVYMELMNYEHTMEKNDLSWIDSVNNTELMNVEHTLKMIYHGQIR